MMKTIINRIVNERDKRIQVHQATAKAAATQTDRWLDRHVDVLTDGSR